MPDNMKNGANSHAVFNGDSYDAVSFGTMSVLGTNGNDVGFRKNRALVFLADRRCPMNCPVCDISARRVVAKIFNSVIASISVVVRHLQPIGARTEKRFRYDAMSSDGGWLSIVAPKTRLPVSEEISQPEACAGFGRRRSGAPDVSKIADLVRIKSIYRFPPLHNHSRFIGESGVILP